MTERKLREPRARDERPCRAWRVDLWCQDATLAQFSLTVMDDDSAGFGSAAERRCPRAGRLCSNEVERIRKGPFRAERGQPRNCFPHHGARCNRCTKRERLRTQSRAFRKGRRRVSRADTDVGLIRSGPINCEPAQMNFIFGVQP